MIVDAHLDVAWNALSQGRGFQGAPAPGYLVSQESLTAGGVGLFFGTLYCTPAARPGHEDELAYRTPREAALLARAELGYYRSTGLPLVRTRADLEAHVDAWQPGRLAMLLLMEGADPLEEPGDIVRWAEQGLRVLSPAWGRTRYAGGTGQPGGLTRQGRELLAAMQEVGVVLDLSHLADQAVEEALRLWRGPLLASHSNARTLVHGDRQLADETVAEVGRRGGVVGVSFFRKHLRADGRPAQLQDVKRHVDHLARVAGGPQHVGLGTDLDGGFAAADAAIDRLEQLGELRPMLRRRFSEAQVEGIMGGNWVELLRRALPGPDGRLGPAWAGAGAEEEPASAWRRPEGEA